MLEKLKAHESAHITMITFWLFEIYEKQLVDAKYGNMSANEQRQIQRDFETLLSLSHVHVSVKLSKFIILIYYKFIVFLLSSIELHKNE